MEVCSAVKLGLGLPLVVKEVEDVMLLEGVTEKLVDNVGEELSSMEYEVEYVGDTKEVTVGIVESDTLDIVEMLGEVEELVDIDSLRVSEGEGINDIVGVGTEDTELVNVLSLVSDALGVKVEVVDPRGVLLLVREELVLIVQVEVALESDEGDNELLEEAIDVSVDGTVTEFDERVDLLEEPEILVDGEMTGVAVGVGISKSVVESDKEIEFVPVRTSVSDSLGENSTDGDSDIDALFELETEALFVSEELHITLNVDVSELLDDRKTVKVGAVVAEIVGSVLIEDEYETM